MFGLITATMIIMAAETFLCASCCTDGPPDGPELWPSCSSWETPGVPLRLDLRGD